jgi:hypothetical protein
MDYGKEQSTGLRGPRAVLIASLLGLARLLADDRWIAKQKSIVKAACGYFSILWAPLGSGD